MYHSPENRGHMLTTKMVHFVKLSKCGMNFAVVFFLLRQTKTYIEHLIQCPDEEAMPLRKCTTLRSSDLSREL